MQKCHVKWKKETERLLHYKFGSHAMEEKAVCYYCATVYPADRDKCPLCGSTKRTDDFTIPQRRERISDQERKRKQKGGKYAAPKMPAGARKEPAINRKPFLIAAVVFLLLAVLVLFWFIADMIGWIPGMENRVDRETEPGVSVNVDCTQLLADPTQLNFVNIGQHLELRISTNATCEETVYCTSDDPAVADIAQEAVSDADADGKYLTFTVTGKAEGTTVISVSCGKLTIGVPVTVAADGEPEETGGIPNDYVPELNWQEVEFTTPEEAVELKVTNLPQGATVIWMSADASVASVDANGVVTAVATGETTVTCNVNGFTTTVKIRCDLQDATEDNDGAHLESTDVTVRVGDKFPLFLYNSESEHIDDITYVVDNASICVVEDNYVKALSNGTTKVRVIYKEQEYICIVRVG